MDSFRFANLTPDTFKTTSDKDLSYNCIAWALGINDECMQYDGGYRWHSKHKTQRVEGLVEHFEHFGYKCCGNDGSLEPGYTKIAVYARNGMWQHAARQLPDGRWASKMGLDEDIEHQVAENVAGHGYGQLHCYMKKLI